MKRIFIAFFITIELIVQLAAQDDPAAPQPEFTGVQSAQQELKEISLSKFEDDGFWIGYIPRDDGFISLRRFTGSPAEKRELEAETVAGIEEEDIYTLGVKVTHIRRSVTYYSVRPIRPIPVPGIAKVLSIWVVGRNVRHRVFMIINDHFGNRAKIYLGQLTHTGWAELRATIPPNIRQVDPRYNNKQGIQITEILVEPDPIETYGNYYFYFDDLRVVTDLFSENARDPDDMLDQW